jgi:tripartite-type tricarboxylate transporter receptor subunit TctC
LPDVLTIAELGFENYQATNWYGFIAPARTPADIIQKLNQAIVASLHDAATLERLNGAAMAADPTTSEQMRAFVAQEYETWGKVVRTLKF